VILATGVGFAVRQLTGWAPALIVGLFVGLLTAPLVPMKAGCGLRRRADL
jgi:hypothetical protein